MAGPLSVNCTGGIDDIDHSSLLHTMATARAWQAPIELLGQLLAEQVSPPAVLVHAPNSPRSAKRLVRDTLAAYEAQHRGDVRVSHVSPLVACTPRLLYTQVLRQLSNEADSCGDPSTFLRHAREYMRPYTKWVVVVNDAERMRDIWPEHVWEMWPLLAESMACHGRVMVVYVSPLAWSAFRSTSGRTISTSPLCIRVPRLPREDVLQLLMEHVGNDSSTSRIASQVFYDAVKDTVRDEFELCVLYTRVWQALQAAIEERGSKTTATLVPYISEQCRDILVRVVPRHVGPTAWLLEKNNKPSTPPPSALNLTRTGFGAMPAFLLISAFLASYNPAITDVKYFVRELEASRKRRRGKAQRAAKAALLELEGHTDKVFELPQFWGPRTFTLERVLAIYHALLTDFEQDLNEDALLVPAERAARMSENKAEMHLGHIAGEFWSRSSTVLAELNELVRQQLIVRMSPANKLSAVQYRVNASFAYVRQVAHSVGFPLTVWLWDTYT